MYSIKDLHRKVLWFIFGKIKTNGVKIMRKKTHIVIIIVQGYFSTNSKLMGQIKEKKKEKIHLY